MNKKIGLVIILIAIIIAGIGFITFSNFNDNNTIQIGNNTVTLPEGYHEGTSNEYGAINITNGTNSIFIMEYNSSDINKYINEYKTFIYEQNQTINITNLTIDNIILYKTENINTPDTVHYLFVKDNKTYDIYKWDSNRNIDSTVIDLIKSL